MPENTYTAIRFEFDLNSANNRRYFAINLIELFVSTDGSGPNILAGGVATSNGHYGSNQPNYAIDASLSTYWESIDGSSVVPWLELSLAAPSPAPRSIRIVSTTYPNEVPTRFRMIGIADGVATTLAWIKRANVADLTDYISLEREVPESKYLVTTGTLSPFIYARSLSSGEAGAVESMEVGSAASAVHFVQPDGPILVGTPSAPYLQAFSKESWRAVPGMLPNIPNSVLCVASNAAKGLVAVGFDGAPFLGVYTTPGWGVQGVTSGPPSSKVTNAAFSHDGSYLAVAHSVAPFLTVYRTSDWSKRTLPITLTEVPNLNHFTDAGVLVVGISTGLRAYNLSGVDVLEVPTGITAGVTGGAIRRGFGQIALVSGTSLRVVSATDFSQLATATLPAVMKQVVYGPGGASLHIAMDNGAVRTFNPVTLAPVRDDAIPFVPTSMAFIAPEARKITGTVRDKDGLPARREVRAYRRGDGVLCAQTFSNATTGDYALDLFEGDVPYDVQFMVEDGELLNDLFYARVMSGTEE